MVPPPQPTRKRVAKTKTVILIIKNFSLVQGMGTGEPIPLWPEIAGAEEQETLRSLNAKGCSVMPGQTKDPAKQES
jgi:hypothetical protein